MTQIDFTMTFPDNFFDKAVNEKFNKTLVIRCLGALEKDVRDGDPQKYEPDLILSQNKGVEFTLASDSKKTENYIKSIKDHTLSVENIEKISIECIQKACKQKAEKHYVTDETILSIILTVPVFVWAAPSYSECKDLLPPTFLPGLLQEVNKNYIQNRVFDDVLIHMPGFAYDWISYSCKETREIQHWLLYDNEIRRKIYPYAIRTCFGKTIKGDSNASS